MHYSDIVPVNFKKGKQKTNAMRALSGTVFSPVITFFIRTSYGISSSPE
jgi:hypothetical protein